MMNKLTYSHKNAAFNGKIVNENGTYWGYYSRDGKFYLCKADKGNGYGRYVLASSDFNYASVWNREEKFAETIAVLRGISEKNAVRYVDSLDRLSFLAQMSDI